jgi:hypothetical protein
MEAIKEFETGNPVKPLRHLGDTDNGDRLVEIQLRNSDVDQINRNEPE